MFNPLAPKLVAELIGTFAFVFIGAGAAAIVGQGVGLPGIATIAFAHGLTIMVFAFAYSAVSGGHFNPAVTIGVLAAGAMRAGEAVGYIISQLVGGVIGALLLVSGCSRRYGRQASARRRSRTTSLWATQPSRSRLRSAS